MCNWFEQTALHLVFVLLYRYTDITKGASIFALSFRLYQVSDKWEYDCGSAVWDGDSDRTVRAANYTAVD